MKPKAPKKAKAPAKTPRKKSTKASKSKSLELLRVVCDALDAKKAADLVVLDVSKQSSITDYLVLATGTSDPHLRALRIELEKALDDKQVRLVGVDSVQGSGWTVVDAFEIMVHIFTPENRAKYRLEQLWNDAEPVELKKVL